jgi:hypothetical protein
MITIFVEKSTDGYGEAADFFVMRDDGAAQRELSGPWRTADVAQAQAENAAHKAAGEGKQAIWTVKPDDVARREYDRRGEPGSRSAWIVR